MDTERLFVSIGLPEPVRKALDSEREPIPGIAWSRQDQLHLTLRFLGDVPAAQFPAILERLSTVRVEPFILPIEGTGSFPPKRPPRVLWCGVGAGHPRLYQLRQRMDDALLGAGVQFDVRTFHPHVTLGRCGPGAEPSGLRWLQRHAQLSAPPFRVEAFDLMESSPGEGGMVHALKERFPLRSA